LSSNATRHPLPFDGTVTGGPGGTSSSGGSWQRPCRTRTTSPTGRTTAVIGCDSETSSFPTCMHFTLGTSSSTSLTCVMPNSSFIVSNIICKNPIFTNSLILERVVSAFLRKKGEEPTNWHGGTGLSRRRRRRRLDSLDEPKARV
jgi:hypothetical protein